ncbi:NYN domain-containing protein [Nocardioides cavernaquae]|uniref:NYN domain-containing protein n=1 Tax=Nocardioides cavernaquae TaxID=2321396 RepID=A0A3A5H5X4_9ACTN|nr:NYN domain-containing protein [Nocardioides cavernaquae]RJS45331.1 NYN domain-containing protein [Nocardioides cavernaquae]
MALDQTRLAVLIDADNARSRLVSEILEELAKYGTPTVRRAYGDWGSPHLKTWRELLNSHAIQPIQQVAYTKGKNATDSALIIDAMDLLYAGNVDAFAIVSSDSDFTRLATRLRESGKTVYGLGEQKTPEAFQKACDRFVFLELLGEAEGPMTSGIAVPVTTSALPDLRKILESAVNGASGEDRWAQLSTVGSIISKTHPSFDPRLYGYAKLVELAEAQTFLDVERPKVGQPRVRLRSARPRKKP